MQQQKVVQIGRRKNLDEVCARHPELKQGTLNWKTLRHILVLEKEKILYCFVPKVTVLPGYCHDCAISADLFVSVISCIAFTGFQLFI